MLTREEIDAAVRDALRTHYPNLSAKPFYIEPSERAIYRVAYLAGMQAAAAIARNMRYPSDGTDNTLIYNTACDEVSDAIVEAASKQESAT